MKAREAAQRVAERNQIVYAIGDVHGRADLLADLMTLIAQEVGRGAPRVPLFFLGDYVDRGLQSRQVIDLLLSLTRDLRFAPRFLKGNHEAAMLDFIVRPETGGRWLAYGGAETLYSYGVEAPTATSGVSRLAQASDELRRALPPAHLDFLTHLELWVRHGDYLFVHAGLHPNRPLEEQNEGDLLTIREPFLKSSKRWPFTVVHGHTPVDAVHKDKRRICVDTGAYMTGRLSAVRIDGGDIGVLST